MAFPISRPRRSSFAEQHIMLSQERKASSRVGRKRSNQAAELSDISIEDESKDDSMMYAPGPRNRVEYDRGAETDSERQVRRISCSGRKRCSAKGVRLLNHDHTTSAAAKTAAVNPKAPSDKIIATSLPRCETKQAPPVTTATTLHSSELKDPLEVASTETETLTAEVPMGTAGNTDDQADAEQVSGTATMEWHSQAGDDDAGGEEVSGMPDWAAELDEVVPGVKVVSIKDAVDILLHYHQLDTPTSVLFPWMHGIGDGPLGANGPLEQFFGNPSLTPPRYRGVSVLKAPQVSMAQLQGDSETAGGILPQAETSTNSTFPQATRPPSSSDDHSSAAHHGPRDRAASTSTFLSNMSSATWASTDSSDPSLYSISSSPQSVATVGTDYWGHSYDDSMRSSATSLETHGNCASDSDEGNAPGQPVAVAMHPTCAKTTLVIDTTSKNARTTESRQEVDDDFVMDMEIELEVPPHISHGPYSAAESATPQSSPPPTPQAPLSAHPTDENSMLRTASAKGRLRSASPTPVTSVPFHNRPEMLKRASSDQTMSSGPEDVQAEHLGWSSTAHDAELLRDQDKEQTGPLSWDKRCMLVNAIKTEDILELDLGTAMGQFKKPDLGGEVSLRNLRIQEVKYGTISDLLLYSEEGISDDDVHDLRNPLIRAAFSIARAQAKLYQERMVSFYSQKDCSPISPCTRPSDDFEETEDVIDSSSGLHCTDGFGSPMNQDLPDELEGRSCSKEDVLLQLRDRDQWQNAHMRQRPVMYNVVIIKESFAEIQRLCPELIAVDAKGVVQPSRDLWLKEAEESIKLAGASKLGENVWLGNGWDDPFRYPGKLRNPLGVNLVIEAHDLADIPTEVTSTTLKQVLFKRLKPKRTSRNPLASPRLQNVPPDEEPIYLEIASSCRARQCMQNSQEVLANRLIALADVVSSLANPATTREKAARILVFCDDGYTETSVFALTYLMVSRRISLRNAYLHLQLTCNRSFFVYQFDIPFLSLVERRLAVRNAATKQESSIRPSSPLSKWKSFGLHSKSSNTEKSTDQQPSEHAIGPARKTWIEHERFDGSLPSRILPHVYLGNIAHAMNSEMLRELGITHVVSVGETLSAEGAIIHGHYVNVSGLTANITDVRDGLTQTAIEVLEIQDVKDDGNDPLRHKIAHACDFIAEVGRQGGKTLIHCRVGVSRSASIVVAYLMKYENKTLLDAYLMTRCRRLNVLIQPNLKFLHELLGWEVETKASETSDPYARKAEILQRYSWPSLCRDLWLMNKKYLVPGDA